MKAGAFTPAIPAVLRAGGVPPARSMKAGAFTPAILGHARPSQCRRSSLNEGGGFHPRNPSDAGRVHPKGLATLNEGGGFHPRNPCPAPLTEQRISHAQ